VPTQSERQALLFLASVALLGAGWRTLRATAAPEPTVAEREALIAHIGTVDSVRAKSHRKPGRASSSGARTAESVIDVNAATAAELEALPRIGPALAARIVAHRDSLGAFGSMEALEQVRGIGPAMAKALAPRVTFSTSRRPTDAATDRPLVLPPQWPSAPPRKHRQ
jgi:competence protein ComEA